MKELLQEIIIKALKEDKNVSELIKNHEKSEELIDYIVKTAGKQGCLETYDLADNIVDKVTEKRPVFAKGLFQDYTLGSYLEHKSDGTTTLQNLRPRKING